MNPRLALLAGSAVGAAAALYRLTHRKVRAAPEPAPSDARAEDLRRKLAESRAVVDEQEEFEAAETPIDVVEPVEELDARRRDVHERGRSAAREMRRGGDAE